MSKYARYQDYVIKNGRLVGEFEQMYKDFQDPWEQAVREEFVSDKALALNAIQALKPETVVELGCGLGHFTNKIQQLGGIKKVVGIDISPTAISKARDKFSNCTFHSGDFLAFQVLEDLRPDVIVMAEITWYVLEKLEKFLDFYKVKLPNTYLIHLLNVYPDGVQEYGKEYFTNLKEILTYFDLNYVEFGEIEKPYHGNCKRTYFVGCPSPIKKTSL